MKLKCSALSVILSITFVSSSASYSAPSENKIQRYSNTSKPKKINTQNDPKTKGKFDQLASAWESLMFGHAAILIGQATSPSQFSRMASSSIAPNYQPEYLAIVSLGEPAVPYIVQRYITTNYPGLEANDGGWMYQFELLEDITHIKPSSRVFVGYKNEREFWIEWWQWQLGKRATCPAFESIPITAKTPEPQSLNKTTPAIILSVISWNPSEPHYLEIEPIALLSSGKLIEPPGFCSDLENSMQDKQYFLRTYLNKGSKYKLLHGGAYMGDIALENIIPNHLVATNEHSKFIGNMLATDNQLFGKKTKSLRQPSLQEKSEFIKLAKQLLISHGVNANDLAQMQTSHLVVTDLDKNGTTDFIGNVFVRQQRPPAIYTAFAIASNKQGKLANEFLDIEKIQSKDLMTGTTMRDIMPDFLAWRFLDQLDINGDGVDEIFCIKPSFEGVTYRIYQRTSGEWRGVYDHYHYAEGD